MEGSRDREMEEGEIQELKEKKKKERKKERKKEERRRLMGIPSDVLSLKCAVVVLIHCSLLFCLQGKERR